MEKYTLITNLTDENPDIPPDSILSRSLFSTDDYKLILFGFSIGQELSEHTSAKPAILHFLSGEADVTLGEDRIKAQAGTWIHMPPHMSHSIIAKSEVSMLLYLLE